MTPVPTKYALDIRMDMLHGIVEPRVIRRFHAKRALAEE